MMERSGVQRIACAPRYGRSMSARILDGQALAIRMQRDEIDPQVKAFTAKHGRPPGLAIVLVGDDPASHVYVNHKVKAGTQAGFRVDLERMPASASLDDVLAPRPAPQRQPRPRWHPRAVAAAESHGRRRGATGLRHDCR